MGLRTTVRNKLVQFALGNLASALAAGQYGPKLQKIYLFGKGYATITGGALAVFFTAATQFDNSGVAAVLAGLSTALAGLGLVRKGAHLQPPKDLPADVRNMLQEAMSVVAWILLLVEGAVHFFSVSDEAHVAMLTLTAVSGFLATYVADSPAGRA